MIRGFVVRSAKMDPNFLPLTANLAEKQILMNWCTENKHIPDIERCVWTVKDVNSSAYHVPPFKKMSDVMVT